MARIVFDLDGTLIDSAPDIRGVANGVLERDGHAPISLDQTRDFIGNGAHVFVGRMRAVRGIPDRDQDRMYADFVQRYQTAVGLTVCYPNVVAALEALVSRGHSLGICTNKPYVPTLAVVAHLGLDRFFDVIVGGDSLAQHKPDPTPLHHAFQAMPDGEKIYVGDSEVDAQTAQRAGVPFLLFSEGYRKTPVDQIPHEAAFSDYDQLVTLIDQVPAA